MKKQFGMLVTVLLTAVGCGETPQVDQAAQPVLKAPESSSAAKELAPADSEPAVAADRTGPADRPIREEAAKTNPPPTSGATAGLPSSAAAGKTPSSPMPVEPSTEASATATPDTTVNLPASIEPGNPAEDSPDLPTAAAGAGMALQIGGEENQPVIEVANLSDEELKAIEQLDASRRKERLEVFVAEFEGVPALDGEVTVVDGKLRFTPRFPLEQGVRYRAVLRPLTNDTALATELEIPKQPVIGTALLEIYPSAKLLPENQLKFYLHFSAPMSRGEAYQHIHLVAGDGKEVEAPFLELGEELWDPTMTRFTLLCDPGRVKRGLKPREEVGPVLEEGKVYSLVIDSAWRDANGNPMASGGGRGIEAIAPDDTPVDPQTWKITPPTAGTRNPLVVRFGESLDHAMLERVISIKPVDGDKLAGEIEISEHETCWSFKPEQPWKSGRYQLVAATTLEDLAGNSIGRAFEVDEERPIESRVPREFATVEFEIGSATDK